MRDQAILRDIELLLLVQELFAGKKIRLEGLNTDGQVFRTVWLELEEKNPWKKICGNSPEEKRFVCYHDSFGIHPQEKVFC